MEEKSTKKDNVPSIPVVETKKSDKEVKPDTKKTTEKSNTTAKKVDAVKKPDTAKKADTTKKADIAKKTNATKKDDNKKNTNKQRERFRVYLRNMGFVICAIAFIAAIIMTIFIAKIKFIPTKYIVLFDIVILIVLAWLTYMQHWISTGIIAKVIALIMTITFILGSVYINFTYDKVKSMTGVTTKIDAMNVFVMKDDPANELKDAKDYTFGRLATIDSINTNEFIKNIEEELGSTIEVEEYTFVSDLVKALYDGEVQAILMNGAYVSFVTGIEEYVNFDNEVKVIYQMDIVSEIVDNGDNEDYLVNGDKVFTIYVSGIDTRGSSPKVNSNSDVNILMTINLETRQILLISTPRDYYVPLSISNGVKDKLTHAGGYGIDVSVDTLEMLYEVNIQDYIKINFTGFIDVIDELGGITVYSDQSFTTNEGIHINEGYNDFNGEEALSFARDRYHVKGGDKGRGNHQMDVIEAVIQKMASSSMLKNYTEILDSLSDSMVTSMTYDQISDLVKFQLNDMKSWEVIKYAVDGYDSMDVTFSAGSQQLYVMVPNQETVDQAKDYLRQIYSNKKIVIKDKED